MTTVDPFVALLLLSISPVVGEVWPRRLNAGQSLHRSRSSWILARVSAAEETNVAAAGLLLLVAAFGGFLSDKKKNKRHVNVPVDSLLFGHNSLEQSSLLLTFQKPV